LVLNFERSVAFLVSATMFLGTGVFYYAIDETGMSHIYSFSLFSIYLYLLQRTAVLRKANGFQLFLVGIIAGAILMIRPSNGLFLSVFFFLNVGSIFEIKTRVNRVLGLEKIFLVFC